MKPITASQARQIRIESIGDYTSVSIYQVYAMIHRAAEELKCGASISITLSKPQETSEIVEELRRLGFAVVLTRYSIEISWAYSQDAWENYHRNTMENPIKTLWESITYAANLDNERCVAYIAGETNKAMSVPVDMPKVASFLVNNKTIIKKIKPQDAAKLVFMLGAAEKYEWFTKQELAQFIKSL